MHLKLHVSSINHGKVVTERVSFPSTIYRHVIFKHSFKSFTFLLFSHLILFWGQPLNPCLVITYVYTYNSQLRYRSLLVYTYFHMAEFIWNHGSFTAYLSLYVFYEHQHFSSTSWQFSCSLYNEVMYRHTIAGLLIISSYAI